MIIYKYDSGWYPIRRCITCKEELSISETVLNNGICIHCGHNSKSILCDYSNEVKRTYKIIQLLPWWPFIFKHEHTEIKK